MRTQCENDGVGPSRTNSWCQPGGETNEFGGAVMVHVLPAQVDSGKIVLAPMALPCVDDVAGDAFGQMRCDRGRQRWLKCLPAMSETRIVSVVPWCRFTVIWCWLP